ncbi:MAG: hypothetical protein ACT4O9_17575 [Blastocatellia bacterium]
MSRITNGERRNTGTFAKQYQPQRNWLFDIEPYTRSGPQTYDDVADNQRLKNALRRSVAKVTAPHYLIDAIRKEIRK